MITRIFKDVMGMGTFTKWAIIMLVLMAGSFFAANMGVFSVVLANDVSRLSSVMGCLFVGGSLVMGYLNWIVDRSWWEAYRPVVSKLIQIPEFIATHLLTLGLLGTIIGFCLMMTGSLEGTDINQIVTQLYTGVAVALFTTLTGLVGHILLELQIFVLKYSIGLR